MATEYAQELLEKISRLFRAAVEKDDELERLYLKLEAGNATYEDAQRFAELVGDHCGDKLSEVLLAEIGTDLYQGTAYDVIMPLLREEYDLVSDYTTVVQTALNERAGIGIKAQTPGFDTERASGLTYKLTTTATLEEQKALLKNGPENFAQSIVDKSAEENARFQTAAGLDAYIVRVAARNCCEWCSSIAGRYLYPPADRDIYRRHENCRCSVVYKSADRYERLPFRRRSTPPNTLNGKKGAALERDIEALNGGE